MIPRSEGDGMRTGDRGQRSGVGDQSSGHGNTPLDPVPGVSHPTGSNRSNPQTPFLSPRSRIQRPNPAGPPSPFTFHLASLPSHAEFSQGGGVRIPESCAPSTRHQKIAIADSQVAETLRRPPARFVSLFRCFFVTHRTPPVPTFPPACG